MGRWRQIAQHSARPIQPFRRHADIADGRTGKIA